ncbi:response regulator transcription factor [Anaplasmataceae bacterium AB001_6]|nr:response regulator transcription factor [Anaplasmataceae bacterium AB001_6]
MRILAVDDDKNITSMIQSVIIKAGYVCDVAHSGQEALEIIKSNSGDYRHDLIVLDRMLNDMDGLDVVLMLRHSKIAVPVIFFSALSSVDNRIRALEFGADDFIAKSELNKGEFLARIRAVLRRSFRHNFSKFKIGNMVLDFHLQVCKMHGKTVPLTNKEYSMLELLCMHGPGAIVSKEKFISHLYSNNEPSEPKIIDVFACKLRNKLASYNKDGVSYIETIWGRGYTLNENFFPVKSDKKEVTKGNSEDKGKSSEDFVTSNDKIES